MGRLFDSEAEQKAAVATRESRVAARERADIVDEAMKELEDTDAASINLSATLARQTIRAIVYQEYREPGSKWMIEHSEDGRDYILQIHPIRPPKLAWADIIPMMIEVMDIIFPRTIKIIYVPPSQKYQLQFYTLKIEKVVGVPGWRGAIDRALTGLSAVEAWKAAEPA